MNKISINLKYLLLQEQISENELSKRVGIPQQVINRLISGSNLNPKLTTISPIANYFKISLHELVFEDVAKAPKEKNSLKVPFISVSDIREFGLDHSITLANKYLTVDYGNLNKFFATEMYDDSMEPKFPCGCILVFEIDKNPSNGDFCLLSDENRNIQFRQVIFNHEDKKHIKSLNPQLSDYKLHKLPANMYIIATLQESRINFS